MESVRDRLIGVCRNRIGMGILVNGRIKWMLMWMCIRWIEVGIDKGWSIGIGPRRNSTYW